MAKESAPGALLEGRHPDDPQDGAHGGCRVRSSGRRRSRDGPDRYLPSNPFRRPNRDRAQTTQDFAVGVSIFLLVLAGTVAFLPNIFAPYDQQVGSAERQQAIRIADVLVEKHTVTDKQRTLDFAALQSDISSLTTSDVRSRAGVADERLVVVEVYERPDDTHPGDPALPAPIFEGGQDYDRSDPPPSVTVTRLVESSDDSDCVQVCRLVVRVW